MGTLMQILTLQFWVASIFVAAVMVTLKKATAAAAPSLLDRGWFKAFMTLSNLAWGLVAAIPKGFLTGDRFSERAMLGVVAGFVSHFAYHLFLKRMLGDGGQSAPGATPTSEIATPQPKVTPPPAT